ncbi:hypothetical protein D3C71_374630 [compost metagenome]
MHTKYITLLLLFYGASFVLHAQEVPEPQYWQLSAGDTAIIFADIAYIRNNPGLEGTTVTDSLPAGTKVNMDREALSSSTVKGFRAAWQEISYRKDGQKKHGYIWLGLLAIGHTRINNGQICIYGFDRYVPVQGDQYASFSCAVKLIGPQQQIVARHPFSFGYTEQSATEIKGLNGMGLKGLQHIVRIGFLGEACAISSDYYYFGWNGNTFIPLPEAYRVSDAGVFYHSEQMLFPSEHKKGSNIIYKMIEEGTALEEDNGKEIPYKIKKEKKTYLWNGKGYVLIKGQKK